MSALEPYPVYKESGHDWFGQIPILWKSRRLKFGFELMKRPISSDMEIVTAFRDGQVTLRRNRRLEGFTEGDKQIGYQGIEPGDLVIHAMDAFAGAIGVSDSRGKSTPVYSVCRPKIGVSADYFALVLRHLAKVGYIESLSKGIRERSTDFRWSDAKNVWVPVPPLPDQQQIVRYLRYETAEIDTFVADQRMLVDLLKERRFATISNAVTKGLSQSSFELGKVLPDSEAIPSHWSKLKLSWAFDFLNGDRGTNYPSRDEMTQEGVPFINAGHLSGDTIDYSDMNYISPEKYAILGGAKLRENDILYCLRGSIGKKAIAKGLTEGALASSLVALRLRPRTALDSTFAFYMLSSRAEEVQRNLRVGGSAQPNLSVDDLKDFVFVVPPLDEQRPIVEHIRRESANIDAAISDAQESISLSLERRAALISAAVTGKIDVRNWKESEERVLEAHGIA